MVLEVLPLFSVVPLKGGTVLEKWNTRRIICQEGLLSDVWARLVYIPQWLFYKTFSFVVRAGMPVVVSSPQTWDACYSRMGTFFLNHLTFIPVSVMVRLNEINEDYENSRFIARSA